MLNGANSGDAPSAESTPSITPSITPTTSRPSTPASAAGHLVVGKPGPGAKLSRRARKMQNAAAKQGPASSGDETSTRRAKPGKTAKKGRKWTDDGLADEEDDVQLDYSAPSPAGTAADASVATASTPSAVEHVDSSTWGSTTAKGQFVLKDLDDEVHNILASAKSKADANNKSATRSGLLGSGLNTISGLFRNVVGGKTLTKEDLDKAMKGMEDHLLKKNVAREAAVRLCEGVEKELIGVKTASFESKSTIEKKKRKALCCRRLLYPPPLSFPRTIAR